MNWKTLSEVNFLTFLYLFWLEVTRRGNKLKASIACHRSNTLWDLLPPSPPHPPPESYTILFSQSHSTNISYGGVYVIYYVLNICGTKAVVYVIYSPLSPPYNSGFVRIGGVRVFSVWRGGHTGSHWIKSPPQKSSSILWFLQIFTVVLPPLLPASSSVLLSHWLTNRRHPALLLGGRPAKSSPAGFATSLSVFLLLPPLSTMVPVLRQHGCGEFVLLRVPYIHLDSRDLKIAFWGLFSGTIQYCVIQCP